MLIKKTKRLNQRKPRLLTRVYKVPVDDLRELQLGETVDVDEKSARLLIRHRLAVKVDETVPEPVKEVADSDDSEPPSVETTEGKPSGTAEEKTPEVPKKKEPKKKKKSDGADYFTEKYPRYTIPDKDKEEDL